MTDRCIDLMKQMIWDSIDMSTEEHVRYFAGYGLCYLCANSSEECTCTCRSCGWQVVLGRCVQCGLDLDPASITHATKHTKEE